MTNESTAVDEVVARATFDADGLLPAIIQQHDTREVLMLGYMDAEALRRTLTEGRVTFWSRSRQEYWRKGDTSGHRQYVRGAALELAPLKIRVNAVRPGLVKTNATANGLFKNEAVIQQFVDVKPLKRTGVPDDIAAGVRYLAGPESSWVTGQSLGIEGGNELTMAPYLESLVRKRFGDEAIERALSGKLPVTQASKR